MTTEHPTPSTTSGPSAAGRPDIPQYEIRVSGRLGSRWAAWFDGMHLTAEDDGSTVIRGPVVDQAALHGLLQKLRDIGIPLVSLTRLPSEAPTELPDLDNPQTPHNTSGEAS